MLSYDLAACLALLDADGEERRIKAGADSFEGGRVLRSGEFVESKCDHPNIPRFDADPFVESLSGAELVWGLRDLGIDSWPGQSKG